MTNPTPPKVNAPDQVAELAAQVRALTTQVAEAVQQFAPVGTRVAELSSAFQAANGRLTDLEARLGEEEPPPAEERLSALEGRVEELLGRLTRVEQVRARGGRLSSRLLNIEQTLDKLANPPAPPTEEAPPQ